MLLAVWICVSLLSTLVTGTLVTSDKSFLQLTKHVPSPNWERGSAAWKDARAHVEGNRTGLWYKPNACDIDVLRSSGPLTVLFSIGSFWQEISARRKTVGSTNKPLEVHVIGASYPFEGRADWSLLSQWRPPHVRGVRVVLILGTPLQSDNVPPLGAFNMLQQPNAGRWNGVDQIVCDGEGAAGIRTLDQGLSKAELCRDHGNGLEVLCFEEYYSGAREKLPRPDLAVMFSPGFPQLERRTWDAELRWMLQDAVPILVSDVHISKSDWGRIVHQSGRSVPHGAKWDVVDGEPRMTLSTMQNYGARTLGAFRGPAPIIHLEHEVSRFAKNGIVQLFLGYEPGQPSIPPPSPEDTAADKLFLEKADWSGLHIWHGLERSLKTPASQPYERACQEMYAPAIRGLVDIRGCPSFTHVTRARLMELGLCDAAERTNLQSTSSPWTSKDWVFIIDVLGGKVLDII